MLLSRYLESERQRKEDLEKLVKEKTEDKEEDEARVSLLLFLTFVARMTGSLLQARSKSTTKRGCWPSRSWRGLPRGRRGW